MSGQGATGVSGAARGARLALALTFACILAGCTLARPFPGGTSGAPDVRGLWVVRTALTHPDSARAAVERADRAGFNTLLVQVRGRGDAWYGSSIEPRADPLDGAPDGYDPLGVVLTEARARGLRVHAWINVHFVASAHFAPGDPRHLVHARPELLAVPRELSGRLSAMDPHDPEYREALMAYARANDDQVEGLYTSPVLPAVREHLVEVVSELVGAYELDGVHLDYVRFPSREFDYGPAALEDFRTAVRADLPADELAAAEERWADGDRFAYIDGFPSRWDDHRAERVTGTVAALARAVRERRPGALVTAAVFPDAEMAGRDRLQRWEGWLASGLLDAVAPMAYTDDDGAFADAMARAVEVAGADRVWIGIGAYSNSFEGAIRKARLAAAADVAGMALFSYDWTVGPDGVRAAGGAYLPRFAREAWGGAGALSPSVPR